MSLQLYTSESVTEGHPDKVADQISDAILDQILLQDPKARVAAEVLVTTGMALISGEITTDAYVEIPAIVRQTLKDIGYVHADFGIDGNTCAVLTTIDQQTLDIAQGVDTGGAGDQGMMYGYATDETPSLMPAPIMLAHALTERLAELRRSGDFPWIRPDGKAQVSMLYDGDIPVRVDTVVLSVQHDPDVGQEDLKREILENGILAAIPREFLDPEACTFHINPTGRFVVGGPHGDTGLTGRKIMVDTYGGIGRHGGGAFSGKDATKVDRSGAYAARWAAKNMVAAGVARRFELQIAYAIGVAVPVAVYVDTFGTGILPDDELAAVVRKVFDLRPRAITDRLSLENPIFLPTAAYGHFGREPRMLPQGGSGGSEVELFTWEKTDRVEELRDHLAL
ncbi:MAG: methionine adenosyltransferase [Gemmatimonadales bacterium]|nr:MAG: methionine adenosyltransferase [Gemmatimonadales bacterium]